MFKRMNDDSGNSQSLDGQYVANVPWRAIEMIFCFSSIQSSDYKTCQLEKGTICSHCKADFLGNHFRPNPRKCHEFVGIPLINGGRQCIYICSHVVAFQPYHTVKSTVRRMNTPVLISFSSWVHSIFSCLWTVLLFLTWLYTRFWLYVLQKHPYCEKDSLSLQTRPAIRFATIYERLSFIYESRMTILSSTLNRIESRLFISEKISEELDI